MKTFNPIIKIVIITSLLFINISPKRFIYLEGGGSRQIMGACFLAEIETTTGKHITETFDYFSGSSMGAILSVLLNISDKTTGKPKYSAIDICNNFKYMQIYYPQSTNQDFITYVKAKGNIKLEDPLCNASGRGSAYDDYLKSLNTNYSQVIKWYTEYIISSDPYMLSNTIKPIYIASQNISTMSLQVFSTLDARKNPQNDIDIRQVVRASSALIGYNDAVEITINGKKNYFSDPIFVPVVNEVIKQFKNEEDQSVYNSSDMKYVYIGTGLGLMKYGENPDCAVSPEPSTFVDRSLSATRFSNPQEKCIMSLAKENLDETFINNKIAEGKELMKTPNKTVDVCTTNPDNCFIWDPYYSPICYATSNANYSESDYNLFKVEALSQIKKESVKIASIIGFIITVSGIYIRFVNYLMICLVALYILL